MKIKCTIKINREEFPGYLSIENGKIIIYRRSLFHRNKVIMKIPINMIDDIALRWRLFYIKGILKVSLGIYIKEIILKGEKYLMRVLSRIKHTIENRI